MKLIGNLKKQVDNATDINEKRSLIESVGIKLTDEELSMVAGGRNAEDKYTHRDDEKVHLEPIIPQNGKAYIIKCDDCEVESRIVYTGSNCCCACSSTNIRFISEA